MSEFINYLHEVFDTFGVISCRKMFGVQGVYHQGLMFALVAGDELYFKADSLTVALFEERGLEAFEYVAKNTATKMSYYAAPEEIFDDFDEAKYWADLGFQAALRANASKVKRSAKKKNVNERINKIP